MNWKKWRQWILLCLFLLLIDPIFAQIPASDKDASGVTRTITIENAREIFFGKLGELEEEVLELFGGVIISIQDGSVTHRIRTDTLRINKTKGLMFATGNVEYEVLGVGDPQRFLAKQLLFESDNMSGLIAGIWSSYEGKPLSISEQTEFFYQASEVTKSVNNTVTLKDFRVATSELEDPYWSLRAEVVWALEDDSWVVKHPFLYLGRVPLLYFPYYYHNENLIFFNPVFGYSNIFGAVINTTTHVWGRPPAAANLGMFDFSFSSQKNDQRNSIGHLAVMTDYYGRNGVMTGLWGGFNWGNIDYKAGVAFTKTQFADRVVVRPSDGQFVMDHGYFFGRRVPFRFGVEMAGSQNNVNFALSMFSDPRFQTDFFRYRRAGADLFGFISVSARPWNLVPINTSESYIRYHNTFRLGLPGLDEISVYYADSELILEPISNDERASVYAASSHFYALRTLNAVNLSVGLKGIIPLVDHSPYKETPSKQEVLDDLDRIVSLEEQERQKEQATEENLENSEDSEEDSEEDNKEDLQEEVIARWQSYRLDLYYTSRFEERLYARRLNTRSHVPLDDWKAKLTWQNLFSNRTEVGITMDWDKRVNFKGAVTHDATKQIYAFDNNLTKTQIAQMERQSLLRLGSLWQVNLTPFDNNTYWSQSNVNYQAQLDFFENTYDVSLSQRTTQWQPNFRTHRLNALLRYDTGMYWAFASARGEHIYRKTSDQRKIIGEAKIGLGVDWYDFVSEGYLYLNELDLQSNVRYGLGLRSQYEPWQFAGIYSNLRVDFKRGWEYWEPSLRIFGLTTGFILQEREIVDWSRENFIWVPRKDAQGKPELGFQLSYFYVKLDQPLLGRNDYAWLKNAFSHWDLSVVGEMRLDLVEYTESKLEIGLRLDWRINNQFTFTLSTLSYNMATYTYFDFMRKELGITRKPSFWQDVMNSFAFNNEELRRLSPFKIGLVRAGLEWRLPDWTIDVSYQGNPGQLYNAQGLWVASWQQRFQLVIKWRPIPVLAHGSRRDNQGRWENFPP